MTILIDDQHYIEANGSRWTIKSRKGPIHSVTRKSQLFSIECDSLAAAFGSLVSHGILSPDAAGVGCELHCTAADLDAKLRSSSAKCFEFGSGRFLVERGDGDWHLRNPTQDVPRLPLDKDRHGKRTYVGYFHSLRSVLIVAVERTLQATPQTIRFEQLDAVLTALAAQLWSDLMTLSTVTPGRILEPV